jgi:hypothetical protein
MKKIKLFAVQNGNSESDFKLNEDFVCGGSNAHSGGVVVLAENLKEAEKLVREAINKDDGYSLEESTVGTLKEIKLDKKGLVIFSDGDC